MTDIDFSALKPSVVKPAEVEALNATRTVANPMKEQFELSMSKEDEKGYGQWLAVTVDGAPTKSDKGNMNYGPVATKVQTYLTTAATVAGKGLSKRIQYNEKTGKVTINYRSKPKGTRTVKAKAETAS